MASNDSIDAYISVKYEWDNTGNGFDIEALGESLIGFKNVIEELYDTSRIQGDLSLRGSSVKEGSIELILHLHAAIVSGVFSSPYSLYDFLQVTDPDMLLEAKTYLSALENTGKGILDYLDSHSFTGNLVSNLLSGYLIYMVGKHQGRKAATPDPELPNRYARKLDQMKSRNVYQKALKPITDGGMERIKLSVPNEPHAHQVTISETNVEDYLSNDQKILPDFHNGEVVTLRADIRGLSNTRGELIKLKVHDVDPNNNLLMAHPPDGKGTEHYRDFYGETVILMAEVFRRTYFKKPELLIRAIDKEQEELQFEKEND